MSYKQMYRAALMAQIVSLTARAKKTAGYTLNVAMQVETNCLYAQIDALRAEYDRASEE